MAQPSMKTAEGEENPTLFMVTLVGDSPARGGGLPSDPNGTAQTEIWDSRVPLGIGYPFRWALERTDKGIRVRRLDGHASELLSCGMKEVSFAELQAQTVIDLKAHSESRTASGPTDLFLKLEPVHG